MAPRKSRVAVAALAAAVATATTYELKMRDGVTLHTDVDESIFVGGKRVPAVLERSPYGDTAEELIALVFAEVLGYVGIRQDFRGTGQSAGNFSLWHDAVNDAYDTISWIIQQPWSNGQVFTTGVSADAIDEYAQLTNPHPALRGTVDVFATTDGYGTFYPGGAYRQGLIEGWLHSTVATQYAAADGVVRAQEQPGGAWWNAVNGSMWYQNINWPSIHWAGWYDIFQQGNIRAFEGFQHLASPAMRGQARLVVDPLGHCQAGASFFPHDTLFGRVLLPFLMALDILGDDSATNRTWPAVPEGVSNVTLYVMGANEPGAPGQYWTTLPDFPVPVSTPYYLQPGGGLSTALPPAGGSGVASIVYDPANPVPTMGGDNLEVKPCGPVDQRPLEGRDDVLLFTTAPLGAPLALTGELTATLYVSSNVTDTDFVVKLTDVYPASSGNPALAGASVLIADGIARMRWRLFPSTADPSPMSGNPSDVYQVNISLWHTSYVVPAGHSLRVHVTSSNWPRFYPNPNTATPMVNVSSNGLNLTAANTVHLSPTYPSAVVLPVVDAATQLPPFPVEATVKSMAARHEPRWRAARELRAAATGVKQPEEEFVPWLQRKLEAVGRSAGLTY